MYGKMYLKKLLKFITSKNLSLSSPNSFFTLKINTINTYFLLGALLYRGFRGEQKRHLKIYHAVVLIASFIVASVGLAAVFDFHTVDGVPNLYSLHSWIGMAVTIFYFIQVGFNEPKIIFELIG